MAVLSHYLTGSSQWYRKATEEVRSTFLSVDEIRLGPKLNACVCLRACIDESLRLSPPGGSALWREVESGGTVIEGDFIPEGYEVGVGVYSVQHSSAHYKYPFEFDPNRWYRQGGNKAIRPDSCQQSAYMPFSVGPRSCVGKSLATAQIMLVFARLLWEFDFRRSQSDPDWLNHDHSPTEFVLKDHLTAQKEGPILSFRARNNSWVCWEKGSHCPYSTIFLLWHSFIYSKHMTFCTSQLWWQDVQRYNCDLINSYMWMLCLWQSP